MTFTPAEKRRMEEIEDLLRNARTPPSNGDSDTSFPNDVAMLAAAQEKLNTLVGLLIQRLL